jgi:methylphosphotriester-DNA--protein-cysteine methyltransferase
MHSSTTPTPLFATDASRWAALQTRNPLAASAFVYCVTTTSICCRPTCKARLARRANVIFHDTYAEAREAGFRACKRCRPEKGEEWDPQGEVVAGACRAIEAVVGGDGDGVGDGKGKEVRLDELAKGAGLTKSHFHRVFKRVTGVTPRKYAVNLRAERILDGLIAAVDTPELEDSGTASAGGSDGVLTPGTPYLRSGHDASGEFVAPELQDLAFNPDSAQGVDCVDSELVNSTRKNCAFTKKVEYTVQPWASGFVLIAATKDSICWLEAGNSVAELSLNLVHEFPLADLEISDWSTNAEFGELQSGKHGMFTTVMEALVRPTGKILDIPFDIS